MNSLKQIAILGAAAVLALNLAYAGKKKDTATPAPVTQPTLTSTPLAPTNAPLATTAASTAPGTQPRDMKLLVITVNGTEPSFEAVKFFLDYLGTPYEVVLAGSQPLPPLTDSGRGRYQGIIIVTGNLGVCDPTCHSALSADAWTALDNYARDFKVRTVGYYAWPEPRYGITATGSMGTDATAAVASYAPASSSIFPYLNRANPLEVKGAWVYLAKPAPAAGETTTTLMSIQNQTVAALHTKADGREYLVFTMDNSPYLTHSLALNYGVFNWVTKGIFLGARKIYLSTQNDDFFLPNDLFVNGVAACMPSGFTNEPTYDPADQCPSMRMTAADLDNIRKWQDTLNGKAQFKGVRTSMVFNASSSAYGDNPDITSKDDLTAKAMNLKAKFYWVNHTWDHETLDCFNPVPNSGICRPATYAESYAEINKNILAAKKMALPVDWASMVTPGISGLTNPDFMRAAKDLGIRYFVGDTSRPEGNPASPNTGIISPLQPSILIIPRRAVNAFYNTYTSKVGVPGSLPDEYNYFWGPGGMFTVNGAPTFSTPQTYADIVDRESDNIVAYMLRYEIYPTMWHQSNYMRYASDKTLFTDIINAVVEKFAKISNLPVVSLQQTDIGQAMWDRMAYNAAQVKATLTPGIGISMTATSAAKVPLTGICSGTCENYGGQSLSKVSVTPGVTVQIPLF